MYVYIVTIKVNKSFLLANVEPLLKHILEIIYTRALVKALMEYNAWYETIARNKMALLKAALDNTILFFAVVSHTSLYNNIGEY